MSTQSGANLDRQVHLASQTLPAQGAQVTPEWQNIPKGTTRVSYWVKYTRGAAGGYCRTEAWYSNGVDDVREIVRDGTLTIVDPNGQLDLLLEQLNGPTPADGNAISWVLTYQDLPSATTRVRLLVQEVGDTDNPGTIEVGLTTDREPDTAEARVR